MEIFLASDHAGFHLKEEIKKYLQKNGYACIDVGTGSAESVNWVEYGALAARRVAESKTPARGILICGTGLGMSMVANKFRGIRAALCHNIYTAEMCRRHNNANVLTFGARVLGKRMAIKIARIFLTTEFEGGRHQQRLDYLQQVIEKQNFKSNE